MFSFEMKQNILLESGLFSLLLILKNIERTGDWVGVNLILAFSINHIIFPYLKITPGSTKEMLSVPFQQTARYIKEYSDEVTEKEKEVIDRVLNYDTLSERYDTDRSDKVKDG